MEEASRKGGHSLFKWPTKPDIQYVDFDQIIRKIKEPKASSKSRRQLKKELEACVRLRSYKNASGHNVP